MPTWLPSEPRQQRLPRPTTLPRMMRRPDAPSVLHRALWHLPVRKRRTASASWNVRDAGRQVQRPVHHVVPWKSLKTVPALPVMNGDGLCLPKHVLILLRQTSHVVWKRVKKVARQKDRPVGCSCLLGQKRCTTPCEMTCGRPCEHKRLISTSACATTSLPGPVCVITSMALRVCFDGGSVIFSMHSAMSGCPLTLPMSPLFTSIVPVLDKPANLHRANVWSESPAWCRTVKPKILTG